jgi:hypothetical protein
LWTEIITKLATTMMKKYMKNWMKGLEVFSNCLAKNYPTSCAFHHNPCLSLYKKNQWKSKKKTMKYTKKNKNSMTGTIDNFLDWQPSMSNVALFRAWSAVFLHALLLRRLGNTSEC